MKSSSKKSKPPKLGQHLLTSNAIARAVVEAGDVSQKDTVLEIGPGKGILTRELLNAGAKVFAIEKDPMMVRAVHEIFETEIKNGSLKVFEADARDVLKNISSYVPGIYRVVANIPYYITGELLRLFLTAPTQPQSIALLVQKEVAERIVKSKKESILSLSVKAYGTPQYVKTVKAGSFNPPPKVDSAILSVTDISRTNFKKVDERFFFELLHAGFGQKRKTLKGNLKRTFNVSDEKLAALWDVLGFTSGIRAEDVSLEAWLSLAHSLQGANFNHIT